MERAELINWLVRWRQEHKGSINEHNHRRLLETRATRELEQMKRRILENEEARPQ